MLTTELFEIHKELNKIIASKIIEISVKQHQITFMFDKQDILYIEDLNIIEDELSRVYSFGEPYITTLSEVIYYTIPDISYDDSETAVPSYEKLITTIQKISEKVCQCPALEYIIAENYIKCFLDKPGLAINDLIEYQQIMENTDATLELLSQRPYLLFINVE